MLRLGVNRCCSDRVLVVPHIAHRRPRYFGPPLFLCDGFWHEFTCQRCNRGVILLSCAGLIKKRDPILPGAMSGLDYCIGVLRLNHATILLERDWLGKLHRVSCGFRTGLSPLDPGSVPPRWARHWRVAVRRINVVAVGKGASIRRTVIFP